MRKHFWKYLINSSGEPVEDARIHVFLTSEVTKAELETSSVLNNVFTDINDDGYVYLTTTKNDDILNFQYSSVIEIKTDSNGFFEFYIADKEEIEPNYGYDYDTYFTIAWIKNGIDLGVIENIQLFSLKLEVDESDNASIHAERKNKLISNKQAYEWTLHKNKTYSDNVHEIYPVNKTDSDNIKNKLVSNLDIKTLQDHVDDNSSTGGNVHDQYLRRDATKSMLNNTLIQNLNSDLLDDKDGTYYTQYTDDSISNHNASSGVHGVSGDIVGTTDTQNLSNKTLINSTFSGIIDTLTNSLSIGNGGTGANNASDARTNLGLIIGVDILAYNDKLKTIGDMVPVNNSFIVGNGSTFENKNLSEVKDIFNLGTAAEKNTEDFLENSQNINLYSDTGTLELSGGFGIFGTPAITAQSTESNLTLTTVPSGFDTVELSSINTQFSEIETKINNILSILRSFGFIS